MEYFTDNFTAFSLLFSVLSAMIRGADNGDLFTVKDYEVEEMPQIVTDFISSL